MAIYKSEVPIMTTLSNSEVSLSASSILSTSFNVYKAFDGTNISTDDCWHSASANDSWAKINFTIKRKISRIQITSRNEINVSTRQYPINWDFQASDDNTNWTTLYSKRDEPVWNKDETRTYDFINNIYYKYYRIYFSSTTKRYVAIGQLKLYSKTMIDKYLIKNNIIFNINPSQYPNSILPSILNNIGNIQPNLDHFNLYGTEILSVLDNRSDLFSNDLKGTDVKIMLYREK